MKKLRKYFFVLFITCFNGQIYFAQKSTNNADSLLKILELLRSKTNSAGDTNVVVVLNSLSGIYARKADLPAAVKYAEEACSACMNIISAGLKQDRVQVYKLLINSLLNFGSVYERQGNYSMAMKQFVKALNRSQEIESKAYLGVTLNNMAGIYRRQGYFSKALEAHYSALKYREELGDRNGIANSLNGLGLIYLNQRNRKKAIENYEKALKIYSALCKESPDNKSYIKGLGNTYSNMGLAYFEGGEHEKGIDYFNRALTIRLDQKDYRSTASTYNNIALAYHSKKNFDKALEMQLKALDVYKEIKSLEGTSGSYINLGTIYMKEIPQQKERAKEYAKISEKYFDDALVIAKQLNQKELLVETYEGLSELYQTTGRYEESLDHYKKFRLYRDSLVNEENTKKSVQAEMNYEFDKKESSAKLEQEKKDLVATEENQKQKIILYCFIGGFALMLGLAIFIFRSYRNKQKANHIISLQKKEVERQKELAERKQKQIVDSINYAKRIQESILTSEQELKKHMPDLFVLYLPKDIVSGDFYWFSNLSSQEFILCAADCTGHGVPGAFLSMVGSTLLNEIVNHNKITDPALIVKELAKGLTSTLVNKQKVESNTDGMDISICKINTAEKKLLFAGANHLLYSVNKSGVQITEPQINSFTGIFGIEHTVDFRSVELDPAPETMVYLSTDGFADQVGEQTNKKFLGSRFEKLIGDIYELPVHEQKQKLENAFRDWKGNNKQIDDVLVIGFKM